MQQVTDAYLEEHRRSKNDRVAMDAAVEVYLSLCPEAENAREEVGRLIAEAAEKPGFWGV